MEGKKVEVHLHTHILVHTPKDEFPSHYEQAIQRIIGRVKKVSDAGFLIEVLEFIGERGETYPAPYPEIFVPQHKIDHIYLL